MLYLIMYLLQFPWETLDQIQWKIVTAEPIFFTLANVFGKILLYGYGKTFYHLLCEQNYYLNFLWNCWQKILISIWQKFTISIFARIEKIYVQQSSSRSTPSSKTKGTRVSERIFCQMVVWCHERGCSWSSHGIWNRERRKESSE